MSYHTLGRMLFVKDSGVVKYSSLGLRITAEDLRNYRNKLWG